MKVPVRLVNESQISLPDRVVDFGFPLPFGACYDPAAIAVEYDGRRLPLQTRILGAWPDGSLQWVLLTSRLDLPAAAEVLLHVSAVPGGPGEGAAVESALVVEEDVDRLRPALRIGTLRIGPGTAALFEVSDGGRSVPISIGGTFGPRGSSVAFRPWRYRLEESGPLRAVVRFEGRTPPGAPFALRIRGRIFANAGDPVLRIRYRVINETPEPVEVGSLGLFVGDPGAGDRVLDAVDAATILDSGGPAPDVEQSGCCLAGPSAGFRIALAQRWFLERFPHRIRLGPSGAAAWMVPPDGRKMTLDPGTAWEDELRIGFGAGSPGSDRLRPERVDALARRPVVAVVDPEWVASTGALGTLAPAGPASASYDESVEHLFRLLEADRETTGAFGTIDFGDWRFPDGEWGNIEYDLAHAFLLHFVRTGDPRFFRRAEEAAVHFMNVDVRRASPADPGLLGKPHKHGIGHTTSPGGMGHTWLQGVLEYGLLTGDPEALDAAREIAGWIVRETAAWKDIANRSPREPGWALIALTSMYRATSDPAYLEAADHVFECILRAADPDGLLRYPVRCPDGQTRRAAKPFMMGIVFEGLWSYAQVSGDRRVPEFVVRAADAMIDRLWVPADHGFRYTDCPGEPPRGRASDVRSLVGLAFAWVWTGGERYLEVAGDNLDAAIRKALERDRVDGKSVGIHTRSVPRYLAIVERGRERSRRDLATLPPGARFEVRGWQVHDPNMERLRRTIDEAAAQGINHLQISHGIVHDAEDLLGNPQRQDEVRELVRLCHERGIEIFSWTHELNAVPDRFRREGKVDLDDEALWEWVRAKYRRFFELAPGLDGLILTFHETDVPVYYDDRVVSSLSHPERVARLIDTVNDVCRELGKTLYVRTFIYRPDELQWVIDGIQACDPSVRVMSKCEPHDWEPFYPNNPALGRFPGRIQVVELDLGCEYYGQSLVPYALPTYTRYRLDYALERGVGGAVARIERNDHPALGTPNALNLGVYARLLEDPYASAEELWRTEIARRYGEEMVDVLQPALDATWGIVNGVWLTKRFYFLNDHSRVPSLGYARRHVASHSVAKWDRRCLGMQRRLERPDPLLAREVLAEKDRAVEAARRALKTVKAAAAQLPREEARTLSASFARLDRAARLWRCLADAYFAWALWDARPDEGRAADVRRALAALRTAADRMEAESGTPDERWASAARARSFAEEIERALEGREP